MKKSAKVARGRFDGERMALVCERACCGLPFRERACGGLPVPVLLVLGLICIIRRFLLLIVKMLNRRPFLSPESETPALRWSVRQR